MKGLFFVDLDHHRYYTKGIVVAHYKKAGFNWSYVHNKHSHENKVRNWYNAPRELGPSEQHKKEDEQEKNSQEIISLQARATMFKRKKEQQKSWGKPKEA